MACLLALAAFAGLECWFRLSGIPHTLYAEQVTELDPYLLTRNRRGLSVETFNRRVTVTTNRFGFRNQDISVAKPEHTYRIIALGDSVTFGYEVGDDETFCYQLEQLLNAEPGLDSVRKYEVVNAGVIGYATVQGLRFLQRELIRFDPDCLIVSFAINDVTIFWERFYFQGKRLSELDGSPAWAVASRNLLYNRSAVCRWLLKRGFDLQQAYWLWRHHERIAQDVSPIVPPDEYSENLTEIVRVARANNIAVIFLPVPIHFKFSIYPGYNPLVVLDYESLWGAIRRMEKVIVRTRLRKSLSRMHYYLGQLYEAGGKRRKALDAYIQAFDYADPRLDYRSRIYQYLDLMVEVARRERVSLTNAVLLCAQRELMDNPSGLYVDDYHPGPLGHRLIAGELFQTLKDFKSK